MALNVCGYCDVDGFGQPVIEIREVSLYNLQESKCKAPIYSYISRGPIPISS